jgi:NADH-quinone oxidoreductase subunit C
MSNINELYETLNTAFDGVLRLSDDGQSVYAPPESIPDVLALLKDRHEYVMLADLSAVEYEDRFEVVYHVMKLTDAGVARIKASLPRQNPSVPSITNLWKAADVQEREAFDLMGIDFRGHPDLRRILCPDGFVGHPLRKSFSLKPVSRF